MNWNGKKCAILKFAMSSNIGLFLVERSELELVQVLTFPPLVFNAFYLLELQTADTDFEFMSWLQER